MFRPLRMLLHPMLVVLLVSSSASASTSVAPTCKHLTDSDSPFLSSLSVLMGANSAITNSIAGGPPRIDPHVFEPIDKLLPALSQCVAETSPLDLVASLMSSPTAAKCWYDFSQLGMSSHNGGGYRGSSSDSGSGSGFDGNSDTEMFREDVCPALEVLAPCLTDVVLPGIEKVMANTHGCCDALKQQITGMFGGSSLTETVTTMVHVVGNAFCTERETKGCTQTCGDSLVTNWLPHGEEDNGEQSAWKVLNGFQIPNNQVCKAVASEPFKTTTGKTEQFGAKDLTPYGACYAPMDELMQYVRDLPMWRLAGAETVAVVDQVFSDDHCLSGTAFVQWASDDKGPILKTAGIVDEVMGVVAAMFDGPSPPPVVYDASNSGEGQDDESSTEGSDDTDDKEKPGVFDVPTPSTHNDESGGVVETVHAFLTEFNVFANKMCIHLPNEVTCDFPNEELGLVFPTNSTSSN